MAVSLFGMSPYRLSTYRSLLFSAAKWLRVKRVEVGRGEYKRRKRQK